MKDSKYFLLFEKKAHELTINNYYQKCDVNIYKQIISNIMWNAKGHIVSLFKDYLIYDELAEFFISFYPSQTSLKKLNELFDYYAESSFIFPNYTPLPESKYIYRSIIKKQRVIDEQENLEELKLKQKKLSKKKKNMFYNFYNDNGGESKFFNSTIYYSILKPSESLITLLFGIEDKNKKNRNKNSSYLLNKNFINNSNSIKSDNDESYIENYKVEDFDELCQLNKIKENEKIFDEDLDDIKFIIKNIHKNEKKKATNMTIKDFIKNNKNNNSKIKIKLGLLPSYIENNNSSLVNKTDIVKIGKNILNDYKSNNYFSRFDHSGNTSGINHNRPGIYLLKNSNKNNTITKEIIQNRTKYDLQESLINSEINNPLVITNYNFKNNKQDMYKRSTVNYINNQNHKKVKSSFNINETSGHNNDHLVKLNKSPNENNYFNNYYRNEFNTPIQKRTQTLNGNTNNYRINKKNDSIININININETNLYLHNTSKNNKIYKKNSFYPKIIPKLDINSIKQNNYNKQTYSKEKEKEINSLRNKNQKNTICLNDLKNIFKNNNFTERNLINNKETPDKKNKKINEKFKLMLGMPSTGKKLSFRKRQNDVNVKNLYMTDNNQTLKPKNNNIVFKKKLNNDKFNKSQNKITNKIIFTESLTRIKLSDYNTDRNNYLSNKKII